MIASQSPAARRAISLLALAALIVCAAAVRPAAAWADGDPASDVLAAQSLFLPADAGASASEQARLQAVVAAAGRGGYPVRVAVVASPADLGSVGALWRRPRDYARFLGQELSLVYGGRVLVVMPDGFGLFRPGPQAAAQAAALGRVALDRNVASVAIKAVEHLAAATRHGLDVAGSTSATTSRPASTGNVVEWGALGLGAILIVLAWAASFRARPPRVRRRGAASTGPLAAVVMGVLALGLAAAPPARADGDPGSDVLVYQNLFVGTDGGVSLGQQTRLSGRLDALARAGTPLRVAIIAGPADLGAITALWRRPRPYARFLGLELSLTYSGRLLVVMPDGYGFNWPGHADGPAYSQLALLAVPGRHLARATLAAMTALGAGGVSSVAPNHRQPASTGAPKRARSPVAASGASAGHRTDVLVTVVVLALAALAAAALVLRAGRGRRRGAGLPAEGPAAAESPSGGEGSLEQRARRISRRLAVGAAGASCAAAAALAVALDAFGGAGAAGASARAGLATNPYVDPGTPVQRPAPAFTLTDSSGQKMSLRSLRGRVVLLAFTDPVCTTVCPLTTTAMLQAQAMLGHAGRDVALVGVDANPAATSLEDVASYTQLHGLLGRWHFLTGSRAQLRRVWRAYGIAAEVQRGLITHTPAVFEIAPNGEEAKVYLTQQSYAAVGQLGQVLAREASRLLTGHPAVRYRLSYRTIAGLGPGRAAALPKAGGGSVHLGPGAAHLYLFFATWDRGLMPLAAHLSALDAYQQAATRQRLPGLTAIDEGSVEPSPRALGGLLGSVPRPLSYPVGIDSTGRVADGYEVQAQPWLVLTSARGRIAWYWNVSTSGWPASATLAARVRAALAPAGPVSAATSPAQTHAPPALAALHAQAGGLLGGATALRARIRALRGYPIVLNVWASWCGACRAEFGLLAAAAAHFGHRVAFLGADSDDSQANARAFLAQHPVGYPSYQLDNAQLSSLAVLEGLPTTIFISPAGRVVSVHTGQYDALGTLDEDIQSYALKGTS